MSRENTISFCTWILNRFPQLSQVFEENLRQMGPDDEWIILDLESTDGVQQWAEEVGDPRIHYYREPLQELHFAKLYNRSHAYAEGDIVVNLDADNFIGPEFCLWAEQVCTDKSFGHSWSKDWDDGTYGRISMRRSTFLELGGYDETLAPVGCQDTDIIRRAITAGYRCVTSYDEEVYGGSIPNHREETMKYFDGGVPLFNQWNSENAHRVDTNAADGVSNWRHSRLPPHTDA